MARKGDTGPYSPENVDCITINRNHREFKHFNQKLDDEMARWIYKSTLSKPALAALYRVDTSTITDIKRRHTWAHATDGLGPPGRYNDTFAQL